MNPLRRLHPSIPAISFIIWWIVASVVFPERMINADGDMLRHITHGSWMLEHGRIIDADPFSFTKPGAPFVAFEYGSQILYALVYRAGGLAGVAIFAGLIIAASYALLSRFLLSRGVDALLAYITTVAAATMGAVHWVARPHLITLFATVVLLHILETRAVPTRKGRMRRVASIFAMFVVWANFHGGFVFGLILLGIYCVGSLIEMATSDSAQRGEWRLRSEWYALAGVAGLVGSLVTPHGLALHQHIVALLGDTYLLDHTQEFLSPDFHTIVGRLFLVGLLIVTASFALVPERPDWRRMLLILSMMFFALTARRNIQLFGTTVFPILALHVTHFWRLLPDWRGIRAVFDRDAKQASTLPYIAPIVLVFMVLYFSRGRVGTAQIIPNAVSPVAFPVEVVRRARTAGAEGRLFHDFIWGGYLLHAWPEQKVFIDGGTDFYGDELMFTYINTTERGRGWRDSLARWDISLALVPTGSSFAGELLRVPGWQVRDCDGTAALLERSGGVPPEKPDSVLEACAARLPPLSRR